MGDNQLGVEVMGHSFNDRTRYSAALLSSTDGQVGLPTAMPIRAFLPPARRSTREARGGSHWRLRHGRARRQPLDYPNERHVVFGGATGLGLPRSATNHSTAKASSGSSTLASISIVQVVTQHGWDNAWFGQGYGDLIDGTVTLNNTTGTTLPAGSQAPTWNGVLFEPHYVYSPQLIFIGRYETIRMSQQATPGTPSNLGNISTYTIGFRYNPFMTSRAGFAWHNEYNWLHQDGTGPHWQLACPPTSTPAKFCSDLTSTSKRGIDMRRKLRMWTLFVGAAAALALPMPSWAQLTKYDLESRMGMESHIGNITGHAKDAKADYRRYCVGCHGELGDGNGENFPWVDPKPRDFQLGVFKCRSTPTGTLPTDEDLFDTIARGLDRSNMPQWSTFTKQERADLVAWVKHFSPRWTNEKPGTPIRDSARA